MKMYLNAEQTAKLIELGFEKPKSISSIKVTGNIITTAEDLIGEPSSVMGGKITANYSIGELIAMLDCVSELDITRYGSGWGVYDELRAFTGEELIDNLYDMIVKLKEEGVI